MSYRTTKVGTATPDSSNDISVDLTDLADVSGTATADQVLKYDSGTSSWSPADLTVGAGIEYFFAGQGESSAYTNSPQGTTAISTGNTVYVYDTSPVNNITGATYTATSNWIESITLPAGKYILYGQSSFEFSASNESGYKFHDGTAYISQAGIIGESRSTYRGGGSLATGYVDLSASTTINLEFFVVGSLDTPANQGNVPSEHGLIYIEKVS